MRVWSRHSSQGNGGSVDWAPLSFQLVPTQLSPEQRHISAYADHISLHGSFANISQASVSIVDSKRKWTTFTIRKGLYEKMTPLIDELEKQVEGALKFTHNGKEKTVQVSLGPETESFAFSDALSVVLGVESGRVFRSTITCPYDLFGLFRYVSVEVLGAGVRPKGSLVGGGGTALCSLCLFRLDLAGKGEQSYAPRPLLNSADVGVVFSPLHFSQLPCTIVSLQAPIVQLQTKCAHICLQTVSQPYPA